MLISFWKLNTRMPGRCKSFVFESWRDKTLILPSRNAFVEQTWCFFLNTRKQMFYKLNILSIVRVIFEDRKLIGRNRGTDVPRLFRVISRTPEEAITVRSAFAWSSTGARMEIEKNLKAPKAEHSLNKSNCSLPKSWGKFNKKKMKNRGFLARYLLIRRHESITRFLHVSHLASTHDLTVKKQ